jgi:hypothetical protein
MASIGAVISSAVTGNGTPPSLFQKLASGIDMPYWTLQLLTALPPTGILGMNHAAMHNQALAIIKAGSIAFSILLVTIFLPYYPAVISKYIIYLSFFGPWFMFDILEVFNSIPFKIHGFRIPLNITLEGLTNSGKQTFSDSSAWKLTTPLLTAILAAFATSGLVLANLIPQTIIPASVTNIISIASGGTGLALSGVALALMVSSAGVPVTQVGGEAPAVEQAGGGSATLPPLSSFADKLIQAKSPDESLAFLSVIVLIVLGGVFTASTRA